MSLDVYLTLEGYIQPQEPVICIRENGRNRRITCLEWNMRFPDREPVRFIPPPGDPTVFSANITHNLNAMAKEAGIYVHLWRPEEIGISRAEQLIVPLRQGLAVLEARPEHFRKLNPVSGWGDYDGLVEFVRDYLEACERYPDASVSVSR